MDDLRELIDKRKALKQVVSDAQCKMWSVESDIIKTLADNHDYQLLSVRWDRLKRVEA